ncbi:radical SAM family heme chaperone HemW [Rossellomorea vietnamensis]|uniref:radical SAM family heme chaperone HemW n=1 Tax=Rossellomorea vietnamensis TaxID=218284 RepID=UPI001E3FD6F5|nr:radical SAM family heme chaperone HemW [Rossellomorea vietnamensis]MCC5801504.1 oxygen-independent coproporphyrinogen III oxidase [Rossellomorea vietnamensis]
MNAPKGGIILVKSAYIHIPFCEHICHYCDFNKVFLEGQPVNEYLISLGQEMKHRVSVSEKLDTIFVGGGTPTSLDAGQLDTLCESITTHLPFEKGEFTFEANPGDLTQDKLRVLKDHGVNRLSFGVQSFNDELLKGIGRTHKSEDVYTSVENAQKVGFSNISIDLIYSLPRQTEEDFQDTLTKALDLDLPHYSAYSLIVEPKTVFYNLMRKGKLSLPSQDQEAAMYEILIETMEKYGINQYEISNFAKPGFESKHNLVYWDNNEYYGLGAGAHGYINGVRYSNYGPLKKYMDPISEGSLPTIQEHGVTKAEMMEEEMFLGLRKVEGVSKTIFQQKFGSSIESVFGPSIEEMEKRGLLSVNEERIALTKQGRFLGNEVFQSFLGVI